jgi:hypothetical protein
MIVDSDWSWWCARRYELGKESGEEVVRQVGAIRDRVWPLALREGRPLYLQFAELDGSPESVLTFTSRWGLLETPPQHDAAEPVSAWRKEIKNMNALLDALPRTVEFGRAMVEAGRTNSRWMLAVTKLDLVIRGGVPGEQPVLVARPTNLLSAMRLQFAAAQMAGVSVRECPHCGKRFEVGGRGGRPRLRSVAKFCSPKCQMASHYKSRTSE